MSMKWKGALPQNLEKRSNAYSGEGDNVQWVCCIMQLCTGEGEEIGFKNTTVYVRDRL